MIHRSGWGTGAMSRISCGLFRGGMALLVGTVLTAIGPTPPPGGPDRHAAADKVEAGSTWLAALGFNPVGVPA